MDLSNTITSTWSSLSLSLSAVPALASLRTRRGHLQALGNWIATERARPEAMWAYRYLSIGCMTTWQSAARKWKSRLNSGIRKSTLSLRFWARAKLLRTLETLPPLFPASAPTHDWVELGLLSAA